ncbi:asparagine synthase-related protein [Halalkalibacter sp. AB-rgal2]|uniref:asparagine synthase-related protein n=1 Tax=Halalkalibacter sp. AB-rgal2 TaxID=3242695 RepID=UPI00359D002D
MSAIAAIFDCYQDPISDEEQHQLLHKIPYRADTVHVWSKQGIFLSCHNQWITQESVDNVIPYFDTDRQLAITADAIVDNRDELCDKLAIANKDRDHLSDSILILLAYEKWGEKVVSQIVGDFAFLIWDGRKNELFGARDFSGARTLYYYREGNKITFCSALKPLITQQSTKKRLNDKWLAEFLALSTTLDSTDLHETVYNGIMQVPPSHTITVNEAGVSFTRFSVLPNEGKLKLQSNEEYIEAFQDVFDQAIKSRLRTTKQVGAHLSGGLDSSAVASFAAKNLKNKNQLLHTYSYAPAPNYQPDLPESLVADETKMVYDIVRFSGNMKPNFLRDEWMNSYTELDDCLETLEMPYKYHLNAHWLHSIYKIASSQNVNVMLNGLRGNWTISFGDALEYQMALFKNLKWLLMMREIHQYSRRVGIRRLATLGELKHKWQSRGRTTSLIDENLVHPQLAKETNVFEKLTHFQKQFNRNRTAEQLRQFHFDQLSFWNRTNTFSAKVSLRYQIADRDPTNDLRVVRFCLSLPYDQFIQKGLDRALVRRATKGYLPESIRLNQTIRGVQGNDSVFRLRRHWQAFIADLKAMVNDSISQSVFHIPALKEAIKKLENNDNNIITDEYDLLMKAYIVYRFICKTT